MSQQSLSVLGIQSYTYKKEESIGGKVFLRIKWLLLLSILGNERCQYKQLFGIYMTMGIFALESDANWNIALSAAHLHTVQRAVDDDVQNVSYIVAHDLLFYILGDYGGTFDALPVLHNAIRFGTFAFSGLFSISAAYTTFSSLSPIDSNFELYYDSSYYYSTLLISSHTRCVLWGVFYSLQSYSAAVTTQGTQQGRQ